VPLSEFGVVVGVVTVTVVAVAAAAVAAVLVAAAARTSSVGGCLAATEPAIQHPTNTRTRGDVSSETVCNAPFWLGMICGMLFSGPFM
jgi:hypothetical protein